MPSARGIQHQVIECWYYIPRDPLPGRTANVRLGSTNPWLETKRTSVFDRDPLCGDHRVASNRQTDGVAHEVQPLTVPDDPARRNH
jgi:hypothetical protein